MKIAYFIGALNRGGAESLILDICRQHKSVPYDFVCIYRHEGNMSEDFKKSGANLLHVPQKSGYNFGHAPLWKRRIVYAISQKIL